MADQAQVGSVDALEAFRSHLINYLAKAQPVVQEASADIRRLQLWLDTEQRLHWEQEVRRKTRALEEAEQALLSARLSAFKGAIAHEQMAVHRARHALELARGKQEAVRRWARELQPRTETSLRQIEMLDSVLAQDIGRAVASLTETLRLLAAYAETRIEPASPGTP